MTGPGYDLLAEWDLSTPASFNEATARSWRLFVSMAESMGAIPGPDRTSTMALSDWATQPWPSRWVQTEGALVDAGVLCSTGVALADLLTFAGRDSHGGLGPDDAGDRLYHWALRGLFERYPAMTLWNALGWALVLDPDEVGSAAAGVWEWHRAGLVHSGWRYAAAGLSPAEARLGLNDQTLTLERAALMAGLRGVALPVAG